MASGPPAPQQYATSRAATAPERVPTSEEHRPRSIRYSFGAEVRLPQGNTVVVDEFEDDATWVTDNGGQVEPSEETRFARILVSYQSVDVDDIGLLADAFLLELADGYVVDPLGESYSDGELQGRYRELIKPGGSVRGFIYYELSRTEQVVAVVFDRQDTDDPATSWLRWTLN